MCVCVCVCGVRDVVCVGGVGCTYTGITIQLPTSPFELILLKLSSRASSSP